MKSMILFCLIGFLVLIATAVSAQDIAINEETTAKNELVSYIAKTADDVIPIPGNNDGLSEGYTCNPCYVITVNCLDCGWSGSTQWCNDCYHGTMSEWAQTVCAQACSEL